MAENYKYKAFISYSHSDEKWAAWLHKTLETYKVPKTIVGRETRMGEIPSRLNPIFRDRDELPSATNLGELLTQSLTDSATQIVICSPSAAKSRWVNEEILTYKRLGRSDRIFCLIVDGEPWGSDKPGQEDQECFPPALRYEIGTDGELSDVRAEPIAADTRLEGDGRANAQLKLIAGMLGVGFDALRQREANRRHRRMLAITTAAVVGLAITSGLAVTAYLARIEAEEQRNIAQIEAETARETAQFMVDLFNVSDPSEARGNTITAREILDKGAARIDDELADQPRIQATLMDTMGSVYQSLGLYPEAFQLLDRALSKRRQELGPEHVDVAETQAHLAEVLSLQAQYEAAEPMYRAALETQRRVLGANSTEIAATLVGLADLLTMDGRFEEAEPMLRESLEIRQQAAGGDSLEVAEGMEYLGMNLYDQGQLDAAEVMLRDTVAMQRRLLGTAVHPQLADSLSNLALIIWDAGGELGEVEALYREALDMNRILLDESHPTIAANLNNLAFILQGNRDYDGAEELFRSVIEMRRKSLGEEHPEVALAMNNLAFLLYDKGEREQALAMARDSLAMYQRLFPDGHPDVATGLTNLSRWLIDQQDFASAEAMLQESLQLQRTLLGDDHPRVAVSLTELGRLYFYTGRFDEAAATSSEARRSLTNSLSENHWRTAWAGVIEGASLTRLDEFSAAESLLLKSFDVINANSAGAGAQKVDTSRQFVGELYKVWGKPDRAAKFLASAKE